MSTGYLRQKEEAKLREEGKPNKIHFAQKWEETDIIKIIEALSVGKLY